MTLDAVGAMWLSTRYRLSPPPVSACSVEQLYEEQPDYWESVQSPFRQRFLELRRDGVQIWLRLDKSPGVTLPQQGDTAGRRSFAAFCAKVAGREDYGTARGLIIGNEPNRGKGGGLPAKWVMTVAAGWGSAGDVDNAFRRVRERNREIRVLIPAVAPWNAQTGGGLSQYPPPPDGRSRLTPWEEYQATLAWCAYDTSSTRCQWDRADAQFAVHAHSNVHRAREASGMPTNEPYLDLRREEPPWYGAHCGIGVYEDLLHQIRSQAGGETPPHLVSEWNTLTEPVDLTNPNDPAWPANNYPPDPPTADNTVGLMHSAVTYMAGKRNLLGFAAFVDDYRPADQCPKWRLTAMSADEHPDGVCPSPLQRNHLNQWNREFEHLLRQPRLDSAAGPTGPVALKTGNGKYVSAEGGGGGRLVAGHDTPQFWGTFQVIPQGSDRAAFRTTNGRYVCAEDGGGRELRANRTKIDVWERFRVIPGNRVAFQTHNGHYIVAPESGELRADRPWPGEWGRFEVVAL